MRLRTQAQSDQLMVVSQRFDPDFKATVDGKPAPVVRCNFLCVGVPVPAGEHEVVIRYRPSLTGFYIQLVGALVVLGAAVGTVMNHCRSGQEFESAAADD
jgi:uncharacterized membrane protein YfhO